MHMHMYTTCPPAGGVVHTYTDVYAFGILMWELVHTVPHPYTHMSQSSIVKQVPRGLRPQWCEADAPQSYR